MKKMGTLAVLLVTFALLAPGCVRNNEPDPAPDPAPENPTTGTKVLVWSDEFDVNGLPDSKKWSYDTEGNATGWGNNEEQFYTAARLENAEVKDGFLNITARKESFGNHEYTSARLITKSKGDWLTVAGPPAEKLI
jgi:hypothetical protein